MKMHLSVPYDNCTGYLLFLRRKVLKALLCALKRKPETHCLSVIAEQNQLIL